MNTLNLKMYGFLPNIGLTRRNLLFVLLWLRPRNTFLAGSPMAQPSYLCSVLFARAPVLGLCFFVSVNTFSTDRTERSCFEPHLELVRRVVRVRPLERGQGKPAHHGRNPCHLQSRLRLF